MSMSAMCWVPSVIVEQLYPLTQTIKRCWNYTVVYTCCAGYIPCSGRCGERKCPEFCLCTELYLIVNLDDSRAKLESTTINYNRALNLLKNTASLVCQSSEEEHNIDDEPYVTELEAIKTAFKNKETVAQDLMLKVKLMEKSKSFWTMVSSATVVFAAITMAYAAKGR